MVEQEHHDAVDAILKQWAEQRPDIDPSPMGVIGRLSRASRLLERGLREHFVSQGLETWEFDVLATLRRAGPPYTLAAKDLLTTAMVGSAALTNRVDRLVARKLVTREIDPTNRRKLRITLTPTGLELVDRALETHVQNEDRLLQGLTTRDRTTLENLLRKLLLSLGDAHPDVNPDKQHPLAETR